MKTIIAAMKAQNIGFRELARKAEMPYNNVRELIQGHRLPRVGDIEKIRKALGIKAAE